METFMVSGLPHASAAASRKERASRTYGPLTPAGVRQLEDPLGARIERAVHRMAEARQPAAGSVDRAGQLERDLRGVGAGRDLSLRLLEQLRAHLGGAEQHRAAAEDARRHGALERLGVGRERHPRRDVGRHHPVLRDRDEQQIEEEALVVGRLDGRSAGGGSTR